MRRRTVLFPQPLGPITATISLASTARSTPETASSPVAKRLETPLSWIMQALSA